MIRNMDKRHAGDLPARAGGAVACETFGARRAWGSLLLTRRSPETAPDRRIRGILWKNRI
ncbi:MAG: hypothetical protein LBK58_01825 [Prevotellaceae bacterium]|nr:hypothetical protein [Prevotellaceae bacterium]